MHSITRLGTLAFALFFAPLSGPEPLLAQTLTDPNLTVATWTSGLTQPTGIAFVDDDDALVIQKTGAVRRVIGGTLQPAAVLTFDVDTTSERGLLGIAANTLDPPQVFFFLTERESGIAVANRVYRYDWVPGSESLINPLLVLDLPLTPGPNHDGGPIVLGPPGEAPGVGDGALLYTVIGDLNRSGQLENNPGGALPDDTAVVLRVQQDGSPAPSNPFSPYCDDTLLSCQSDTDCNVGATCVTAVERYYGYGVRNSFGLALDPVTGALWDTENGPGSYDEVNRVDPGFNSGWLPLMGPDSRDSNSTADLFDMPGSTYSDPEFSWLQTVAPTSIVFPFGSLLGPDYDDVALVGDNNTAQLYAFPLNDLRDGFELGGFAGLSDLVADNTTERNAVAIGSGFPVVTDLEIGPDGALYVVTWADGFVRRVEGPGATIPLAPSVLLWALGAAGLALALAALGAQSAARSAAENS